MLYVSCKMENINFGASLMALIPTLDRFRIPLGVGVVALRLMPEAAKQVLVLSIVKINERRILGILESTAAKHNIKVSLQDIRIRGVGNMLNIGIVVEDLDYGSVAEAVLPMLNDLLSKTLSGNPKLHRVLYELLKEPQTMSDIVYAVLDNISDETINNMASTAVNCYQEEILNALNGAIHNKGIVADISEISLNE